MQKAQTPLPVGTIIRRRYLVEDQLGKSSSGAVYLVRDQRDRQNLFALKEVILARRKVQTRLTFQSLMLKRLDHPALPRVYDVFNDEIQGRAYILMNYIKGLNLETLRQQQPGKRFSLPQSMTMMAPIMDTVAYLHSQYPPIIHGDIKAVNIIWQNDVGEAILVDLGIAEERDANTPIADIHSSTSTNEALEQYSGGTGPRLDIYALGATLYTLLTGTVPSDAFYRVTQLNEKNPDPLVLVNQITPSVPIAVAKVLHRAMSINSSAANGNMQVLLAEYEGNVVAGMILLASGSTVRYAYGASDERYLHLAPNNLLMWTAITWGCTQGYETLDMGRTANDNKGLMEFKGRWGAVKESLPYYYYPHVMGLASTSETSRKFQLFTSCWRRLPLQVAGPLGGYLYKHLG